LADTAVPSQPGPPKNTRLEGGIELSKRALCLLGIFGGTLLSLFIFTELAHQITVWTVRDTVTTARPDPRRLAPIDQALAALAPSPTAEATARLAPAIAEILKQPAIPPGRADDLRPCGQSDDANRRCRAALEEQRKAVLSECSDCGFKGAIDLLKAADESRKPFYDTWLKAAQLFLLNLMLPLLTGLFGYALGQESAKRGDSE
jgi:hypothetical protein